MKKLLLFAGCLFSLSAFAQKKPLDHSVYDGWQSVGERAISNDGKYIVYSVNPQEGDGMLTVQSVDGSYKMQFPRGYGAVISEDSRCLVFRIKPFFRDTRDARIKKRKADEMPKDSLGILQLGSDKLSKIARIKSFKMPEEGAGWLAYLMDKPETLRTHTEMDSASRITAMQLMADSLLRAADSIRNRISDARAKGMAVLRTQKNDRPPAPKNDEPFEEGTELVLRNLQNGQETHLPLVSEYFFNKKGTVLLTETTRKTGDAGSKATVSVLDLARMQHKTIFSDFHDAKGYRLDEEGKQLAFVAERDSSSKALEKFYKLYYYRQGGDSAALIADRQTKGLPPNSSISENAVISFSKSGNRLFAGTAAIIPPKDTTLPDFERVNLDVWHYNDDYIQPQQLRTLESDLRRNYTARVDLAGKQLVQLANDKFRGMLQTKEGDGDVFYAVSDEGKRVATQWQGFSVGDIYAISPETGVSEMIRKDFKGNLLQPSFSGKYLLYYDERKQGYFVYDAAGKKTHAVAKDTRTSLYDEQNDVPDDPNAYGAVKWMEDDTYVLIYDRYDIWRVDPRGVEKSVPLTNGRKDRVQYRYVNTDPNERYLKTGQSVWLLVYDEKDKSEGIALMDLGKNQVKLLFKEPLKIGGQVQKAKDADVIAYTKESFAKPADLYVQPVNGTATQLSHINPQQPAYNWGSAELFRWKAYTGKETEGVLYKPEGFDPRKKYPMLVYFYERSNNTLNSYIAPSPTPSRLNIPFFVSRGYVVFVPDIWYTKGHPGQSAYDHIVSGTRALVKQGYIDSTRIGLQGQSWGGYQIVYLITRTNLYAAAWAGAPVANMTSAYGGIRWGTGLNRQFQYEKTQSRIGATLWEKPNLYVENSALFALPKVNTPLVIMANDADDAVPWYQGIEMYTGMRRLGKKVWMLNYNNEAHNLVERRNRKDIQIREQQFFDYLLKGGKPAKWISEGVPAVMKGRDWGLGY
ncbi:S9 family peptidase [Sediminibacterium soli]|uniref:S9 family peptidase n=1 Tax=Sediminibacterium soli TaxID=2698829 RepID=UPI0013798D0A|nr:prolyl oligopeptidase family serine peptidase [Sediminibacterium soli]NCI46460.1 S9 family peptidase [Sediminibacterium soli]